MGHADSKIDYSIFYTLSGKTEERPQHEAFGFFDLDWPTAVLRSFHDCVRAWISDMFGCRACSGLWHARAGRVEFWARCMVPRMGASTSTKPWLSPTSNPSSFGELPVGINSIGVATAQLLFLIQVTQCYVSGTSGRGASWYQSFIHSGTCTYLGSCTLSSYATTSYYSGLSGAVPTSPTSSRNPTPLHLLTPPRPRWHPSSTTRLAMSASNTSTTDPLRPRRHIRIVEIHRHSQEPHIHIRLVR